MKLKSSINGVNATDSTALRRSTTEAWQKLQGKCEAGAGRSPARRGPGMNRDRGWRTAKLCVLLSFGTSRRLREVGSDGAERERREAKLALAPLGECLADFGGPWVFDLLEDFERGFCVGDRLGAVTQPVKCKTHIP